MFQLKKRPTLFGRAKAGEQLAPRKRCHLPIAILAATTLFGCLHAARSAEPWWTNYHTLVSHSTSKVGKESELGMMAERGAWPTGWYGAWWIQHQVERRSRYPLFKYVDNFRNKGVKSVFYFDAGEFGEFVALIHNRRISHSQWELRFYKDEPGHLMWFGKDGFYRDDNPLLLKNYQDFGLPAWTMPDGSRPTSIYDFACISFDSKRDPWDFSGVHTSSEIDEKLNLSKFLRSGNDPVPDSANKSLGRICTYDHSNPFLLKDFEIGVGLMLQEKPGFIHFDNYFDNETLYPSWKAFGPWSRKNFQTFMQENIDSATLAKLGVDDPNTFDIRQYILNKPFQSRGEKWHFSNKQWYDDPIWNVYVCSKIADADHLFRDLYRFCKRQSNDMAVVGNTCPLFPGRSLASGAVDIAHFEHHAATQYGPLATPTGLPPLGRLAGVVRLGAAISNAGYCWPSVYVPKELSGSEHQNLHKVIAADCLANRGVLDYNHQYLNGYSPGCDDSAAWANCFIKRQSEYYGDRIPVADVALVFPGQSVIGSVTVFTMRPEQSLHDYLGWAQGLTELHVPWDVVTDDQITSDRLQPFKAVILPSAVCLSDKAVDAIKEYQNAGGRILLSGDNGTRYGIDRFLWFREPRTTLHEMLADDSGERSKTKELPMGSAISADSCCVCSNPPGKLFYEDIQDGERVSGRVEIQMALETLLPSGSMSIRTNASTRIGITTYQQQGVATYVDLVNYDLDLSSDQLTPAGGFTVVVRPPVGQRYTSAKVRLRSPDHRVDHLPSDGAGMPPTPWDYPPIEISGQLQDDGSILLHVPKFNVYCTLAIPASSEPSRQGNTTSRRTGRKPYVRAKSRRPWHGLPTNRR